MDKLSNNLQAVIDVIDKHLQVDIKNNYIKKNSKITATKVNGMATVIIRIKDKLTTYFDKTCGKFIKWSDALECGSNKKYFKSPRNLYAPLHTTTPDEPTNLNLSELPRRGDNNHTSVAASRLQDDINPNANMPLLLSAGCGG